MWALFRLVFEILNYFLWFFLFGILRCWIWFVPRVHYECLNEWDFWIGRKMGAKLRNMDIFEGTIISISNMIVVCGVVMSPKSQNHLKMISLLVIFNSLSKNWKSPNSIIPTLGDVLTVNESFIRSKFKCSISNLLKLSWNFIKTSKTLYFTA